MLCPVLEGLHNIDSRFTGVCGQIDGSAYVRLQFRGLKKRRRESQRVTLKCLWLAQF